jgi:AcrR family transcriptional regulator
MKQAAAIETAKRKRPHGRSADVQARVFAAARALFRPGLPLPTMAAIAARAGVQKTTLYRRWTKAETLVGEALRAAPAAAIPVPNTGSLRADLRALARAGARYHATAEGRTMTTLLHALADESKRAYWTQRYEALRGIFDRAVARGEIGARADWGACLDLALAPVYFYAWAKGDELPLARRYELLDILITALKAPRPNAR